MKYLSIMFCFGIAACHPSKKSIEVEDAKSVQLFKNSLSIAISKSNKIKVSEINPDNDSSSKNEHWSEPIYYKSHILDSLQVESLRKIVLNSGDFPRLATPTLAPFSHVIIISDSSNQPTYIKISTESDDCYWTGSNELIPSDLHHNIVSFLNSLGFNT